MLHYCDCQSLGTLFFISDFTTFCISDYIFTIWTEERYPPSLTKAWTTAVCSYYGSWGNLNVNPAWGISPSEQKEGDSAEVSLAQRFLWNKVLDRATINRKSFLHKWPSFQLRFQSCICSPILPTWSAAENPNWRKPFTFHSSRNQQILFALPEAERLVLQDQSWTDVSRCSIQPAGSMLLSCEYWYDLF